MKIIVYDTETYTENSKIHYGIGISSFLNSEEYIIWHSKEALKNYFLSFLGSNEQIYIIAHNGFNFDLPLIFNFNYFIRHNYKIISNRGRTYLIQKKNIKFIDSYNLIPISLHDIGDAIGLSKGDYQEKLAIMNESDFFNDLDNIIEYCKNDVKITKKAVSHFFDLMHNFGVHRIPLSASSFSLSAFKKNTNTGFSVKSQSENKIIFDPEHIRFLFSFYGGRNEAFYIGEYNNPVYAYDFNSLYPYELYCNKNYPGKYKGTFSQVSDQDFLNYLTNYEGMGFFEIDTNNAFYFYDDNNNQIEIGLIPYHANTKIMYPTGKFKTYANFNEIRMAIKYGYSIKPLQISVYERLKYPMFSEYIKKLYDLRKSDKAYSYLYKIMLNSLYGKLGEIRHEREYKMVDNDYFFSHPRLLSDFDVSVISDFESYKMLIEIADKNKKFTSHTFFNLYSYLTSYARIELIDAMYQIIQKNGQILYCDTDSVFTNIANYENLNDIGKLKLEHVGSSIHIYGQKSYVLNESNTNKKLIKLKGISKHAEQLDSMHFLNKNIIKSRTALKENIESLIDINTEKTLNYTTKRDINIILDSYQKPYKFPENYVFEHYDLKNTDLLYHYKKIYAPNEEHNI